MRAARVSAEGAAALEVVFQDVRLAEREQAEDYFADMEHDARVDAPYQGAPSTGRSIFDDL